MNSTWLPVSEADKNLKSPLVDREAGAEVLFWRVYVSDEMDGSEPRTVLHHYVRVKVFNDRGREALKTVDLVYGGRDLVDSVAGRTTEANGTIVELGKDATMALMGHPDYAAMVAKIQPIATMDSAYRV